MGQAVFSGNGNYTIDVDAALVSQNQGAKQSTIYWRTIVLKGNTYGHAAWGNTGSSGWADSNVGGNPDLWNNGNMEYNFQNGQYGGTFLIVEGTFVVQHAADGTGSYFVSSGMNLVNLGSASAGTGWRDLPRLADVPPAPSNVGWGTIDQTSIQYMFLNNGDGGSPVLEWQVHYGLIPTYGEYAMTSGGATPIGGLLPGKTYYFWSRGRNAIGWGPWSPRAQANTKAGARIKIGSEWKQAVPYVKIGSEWKLVRPIIKVNGTWKKSE